jgi:eukaryotic-like serine/threonine-protein kinase
MSRTDEGDDVTPEARRPTLTQETREVVGSAATVAVGASESGDETMRRGVTVPPESLPPRYDARSLLGSGGMGDVHLCADRLIGREVAFKVMRAGSGSHSRFVREAKVQARLEHPSIVPVYDFGQGADGSVWFTMKRIRGRTLADIIDGVAAADAEIATLYPQRKLVTAFLQVCLAIHYAHEQGVVHRDLKPANIMLGAFGEVNVLDWGVAKVVDEDESEAPSTHLPMGPEDQTLAGSIIGTPGYMAPEQVRGEAALVDRRADVYALGAILFEILALEPLHRGASSAALLASTLREQEARPSARSRAVVPPELEAICVRATELEPDRRFGTAREIADALERYLNGDRDLERRREIAAEHLANATALLEEGTGKNPRAEALRELGRAVALQPDNAPALDMMARLLVEAPEVLPPDAEREMLSTRSRARREAAQLGAKRYLFWCAFVPFAFWMGVRDWLVTAAIAAFLVASGVGAWWTSRRPSIGVEHGAALLVTSSVAIALTSAMFGVFMVVPALAATNTMFFAMSAERRHRRVVAGAGVAAVIVPWACELLGLVPSAYSFELAGMRILPRVAELPAVPTSTCLLLTSVATVVVAVAMIGRLRDALVEAERRLFAQAWHLRQLVPAEARGALSRSASTPAPR